MGVPERYLFSTVTKARDLFRAGECLADATLLRRVIDLPIDLDETEPGDLPKVLAFLKWAKEQGAADG